MSKFYKIFFSVIAAFLVLLVAGSVFLTVALADYEKNLPVTLAEKFFSEQIKTAEFSGVEGSEFETREALVSAFGKKYKSDDLILLSSASSDENIHKYVVKSGEERVISFEVVKSGEKSFLGSRKHKITNVKFLFGDTITLRAPADCKVFVNGVEVGEEYRKEEQSSLMDFPSGVSAIPVYTYKIGNICTKPEVIASDEQDNTREVLFNEKSGEYEVGHGYSEQLKNQYGNLALEAAKTYSAYMQSDASFGAVAKYFQYGTTTYENIRTSEVYWVWAHEGFEFSDEWCGEFKQLSDTVFTCRVKVTQTLFLTNNQPYKDYVDVTLCFNKQPNGNYLVYSLKGNR